MASVAGRDFYGWKVVAACFVLAALGWGLGFYSPAILLYAVRDARGWPVPMVSAAVTAHFLAGVLVVANLHRLHARFGVPAVTKAGASALALGILGWAGAAAPWQLLLATLLSGAGWVAMGAAAVNAIIAPWFEHSRPRALAMAYNGASIGGAVFSPLWVWAIAMLGLMPAAALLGAGMVATVWVLSDRVFSRAPGPMGQAPDGVEPPAGSPAAPSEPAMPGRVLWRDRKFRTLAAGMALGLFAQAGLIIHLFSLLVPLLGAQGAGMAMGLATASAIGGRTLVGWLMPADADRRLVACASYGTQIAGAAVLAAGLGGDAALALLGVVLFGAGIGNATSLPPLIAQAEFAKQDVPRAVSLAVAISQATYALAPAAFGLLRAASTEEPAGGDGLVVLGAAAVIQALAICALLLGRGHRAG